MDKRHDETMQDLLPAYALRALDPTERRRVDDYLAAHPEARDEVEAWRESLAPLALAAPPLAPPPGARAALLARVEGLAAPASAPLAETSSPATPIVRSEPTPFRRPAARGDRRWRAALAALAAALILALVGWNAALQRRVADQAGDVALGRLIGDARFAHALRAAVSDEYGVAGPAGYAYADPQGKTALLNCYWMPTLPADRIYQVWLVRPDGSRDSGGTFTVDARGNASVVVRAPQALAAYNALGVTVEPTGGSAAGPTTRRVVWAELR